MVDTRSILIFIFLCFIISVSSIAYILTLQDGHYNLDELFIYNHKFSYDKDKQLNTKDYSTTGTKGDIKVNDVIQVILEKDEYKLDVLTEQDKSNDCISEVGGIADPLIKEEYIKGPERTLYQSFE